jgi:hypothetical protein
MTNDPQIVEMTTSVVPSSTVPRELATAEPPSLETIIHQVIQSGRPVDELKELFAFAKEVRAAKALTEFNAALAEFKRTCPRIIRRTENPQFQVTRNGVKRLSRFASLSDISEAIDGALGMVGLGYDFTDADFSEAGKMKMGCFVRHAGGHVAAPRFVTYPLDTAGAGSSPQQKIGSVTTYCMRYSLKAALGLTDCDDDDDDGAGGTDGSTITEAQAETLNNLLIQAGRTPARFLKVYGVGKVADLPAGLFNAAANCLNEVIGTNRKKA